MPFHAVIMIKHCLLSIGICFLMIWNSYAQVKVPNGGFEQPDNSSVTKTLNWKPESDNFFCATDNTTLYKGSYSLKVSSATEGHHFFSEEFPFEMEGLKKYKISCAFKTTNLKGIVQLGARVFDADGNTITRTVFVLTERPDQEWTIFEGIFVSDETASKLRVYGNLLGTGDAWFDDISIVEIPPPTKGPLPEVMLYIHEYFDIVYERSIINDKKFISDLKSKTMYLCSDSMSMSESQNILKRYTTPMLKDGHSFFATQQEWKEMTEGGKSPVTNKIHHDLPDGKMLQEKIAYINLPTFVSLDEKLILQYADKLQSLVATFDAQNPNGYIIDLSNNGGGNSLPMIAGVGPLIGNGVCGYSFSGDGSIRTRIYNNGWAGWDTMLTFHKPDPYQLKHPNKPIAVIYSNKTGSSGEVTAIAFIGLPHAKSFGQQTAGATTRIDNYELNDGAYLNLASGIDADRNKNQYGGTIAPDKETADTETAIKEAIKWILKQ